MDQDVTNSYGPLPHKGPNFRPISIVAKRLDASRCHLVRRWASAYATLCSKWTQLPPEKRNTDPTQFLAHVYSGQTAGWMKTPLGKEVDRGPGHIVFRRGSSSRERGTTAPLFSSHVYCGHCRSPISATAEFLYKWSLKNGRPNGDVRYDGCDSVGMISC